MYNHIVREADYKLWSIEKEIFVSCYELIFVVGGIKASDGCTTQGWVKVNKEYKDKYPISLIALEYIGLNDSRNEKIYNGDIVEFEDTGEDGYEVKEGFEFKNHATVVFSNGGYTLENFAESENSYYANDGLIDVLHDVLNSNCKIIGNIYSDPNL